MSVKGIIRIFAYGIFACSAILLLIGGTMIGSGSAVGNTVMIDNGWSLVNNGIVLFVLALLAWVIVKIFGYED